MAQHVSVARFKELFEAMIASYRSKSKSLDLIGRRIGLAISGGPDSMALGFLAGKLFGPQNVAAFTIDHGLQEHRVNETPELTQERIKTEFGIDCDILRLDWNGVGSGSAISIGKLMSESRDKRYEVLHNACQVKGIPLLLTAHNQDDDIVTMLHRIAHMSGIEGIAGMRPITAFPSPLCDQVKLGRPLLAVPKSELRQTCILNNISWAEDSSNSDLRFRRNAIFASFNDLIERDILEREDIVGVLGDMKGHREHIYDGLKALIDKSVILNEKMGEATLVFNWPHKTVPLWQLSILLKCLIQYVTVAAYPPKTSSFEEVAQKLFNAYTLQAVRPRRNPFDFARLDTMQSTTGNAMIYPLSKDDSVNRVKFEHLRTLRPIANGPCVLITREPRVKKDRPNKVEAIGDSAIVWNDQFRIVSRKAPIELSKLTVLPATASDIKEAIEVGKRVLGTNIRPLYEFVKTTAAMHYGAHPVIREISKDSSSPHIAFPTLGVEVPGPAKRYDFATHFLGLLPFDRD